MCMCVCMYRRNKKVQQRRNEKLRFEAHPSTILCLLLSSISNIACKLIVIHLADRKSVLPCQSGLSGLCLRLESPGGGHRFCDTAHVFLRGVL